QVKLKTITSDHQNLVNEFFETMANTSANDPNSDDNSSDTSDMNESIKKVSE
ncbi:13408_t:CDS:1, partial [Funneliformis geosporum]